MEHSTLHPIRPHSDNWQFINDLKAIVYNARRLAYNSVDLLQVACNWLLGYRIVEQEQHGEIRAGYGKQIIQLASKKLTEEFGSGFSQANLKSFRKFYIEFKTLGIGQTLSAQLGIHIDKLCAVDVMMDNILPMPANLSWSHYERLSRISNATEREWYMQEASRESWSVRTLMRNIGSQYYHRLLQSPSNAQEEVRGEMKRLTECYQHDRHKFMRNPVVAEFLGFRPETSYTESKLESAILQHIEHFMLDLGKGFAFVARQQRIKTDMGEYFIDLVFYNYILKCFMLVDLKTSQITHQDVGQMDMYVRMYDELRCTDGDNPTIGLLLCSETSKDLARYSILKDSKQIYAAKYLTYLPTQEELEKEIKNQKEIFALQSAKMQDC